MKHIFILFIILSCQKKIDKTLDIDLNVLAEMGWPHEIQLGEENKKINYTFDDDLMIYLQEVLIKSKSDQIAISVIDNNTGDILALVGRDNKNEKAANQLAVKPLSPAASLVKVITSADLLNNHNLSINKRESFIGRKVTLYKNQLKDSKKGKETTLKKAFSSSNNVIFAKLSKKFSNPRSLFNIADDFYFNKELPVENAKVQKSFFPIVQSDYEFAEISSGLNKKTLTSPLHMSYIVSVIANEGKTLPLKIFKDLTKEKYKQKKILKKKSAQEIFKMMRSVVDNGTAKSLTRKISSKIKNKVEFGGKTGRMTGGVPSGTRDWFAFYIRPKDKSNLGWSLSVMIVNGEKWTVRPTYIAKKVIEYYYSKNKYL